MFNWKPLSGSLLFLYLASWPAVAQNWQPLTGAEKLREILSDTDLEATLVDGVTATARYNADGTGVVNAWGKAFPRTWDVSGDDKICLTSDQQLNCVAIERDLEQPDVYRATNLSTGEQQVFSVASEGKPITVSPSKSSKGGGAAAPSAEELAKSLANPNTPLASQNFKLQYRTFKGDLPGADDESGTTLLYQPAFPFPLDSGALVFFRPAIPIILDQPVFDVAGGDFESEAGLGDIGFDLAYGRTTESGLVWAAGIVSVLPTATEDTLGPDKWNLGPEFLIGKISSKYVLGALTTYQTDVGGSGDADISITTINAFATLLPGGGWNIGSAPIMSYDHENSQWTLPLNLAFGKTVVWNGRPWKLGMEINYYVDQADSFGPEWMIGLNISPVMENVFAKWFN